MIREIRRVRLWAVVVVYGSLLVQQSAGAGVVEVVKWGGDYVTSTQSLKEGTNPPPAGTDSYLDIHSASDSSTTPTTNYYGRLNFNNSYNPDAVNPNTPNSTFYGGHVVVEQPKNGSSNSKAGMSNLWIANNVQGDYLEVDVNPSNTLLRFAMLTYWNLPIVNGEKYKLNGDSIFTLRSSQDAGDKPDGHKVRWVVRDSGNYYLSKGIDFSNSTSYSTSGSALTNTANWFAFNPLATEVGDTLSIPSFTSLLFNEPATGAGIPFMNITAVGFYVEFTPPNKPGADKVHYKVQGFNVLVDPNGNAVPEPSTFLLGLAGFGGVALKRWRKRRESSGTDAAQLTEAT